METMTTYGLQGKPEDMNLLTQPKIEAAREIADRIVDYWVTQMEWRATEHSPAGGQKYPYLRGTIAEALLKAAVR
jgi:hypothetical protein